VWRPCRTVEDSSFRCKYRFLVLVGSAAWQFGRKQRIVRSVRVSYIVFACRECPSVHKLRLVGAAGVRVVCVSGGDRKYTN